MQRFLEVVSFVVLFTRPLESGALTLRNSRPVMKEMKKTKQAIRFGKTKG